MHRHSHVHEAVEPYGSRGRLQRVLMHSTAMARVTYYYCHTLKIIYIHIHSRMAHGLQCIHGRPRRS